MASKVDNKNQQPLYRSCLELFSLWRPEDDGGYNDYGTVDKVTGSASFYISYPSAIRCSTRGEFFPAKGDSDRPRKHCFWCSFNDRYKPFHINHGKPFTVTS
ncbi:hypothetical protein FGIG_04802 [Fasciola gigantica]|uniref:Uncharacterized protein n=1 Tax=Fasciola gigantica TaxID=46835 RepID=A0A504YS94_FASGI|nr:hypothetical protein FGIG_04802 [Fasciola gigantica]